MTISNVEVQFIPSESTLYKYAIKHNIFEKRLILAWFVLICVKAALVVYICTPLIPLAELRGRKVLPPTGV